MRRPLVHMAASIWMPELDKGIRPVDSRLSVLHHVALPPARVRPMPEQMLTGQLNVIQYSADGLPSDICRPVDRS